MKQTSRRCVIILVMIALSMFIVDTVSATPITYIHLPVNGFTYEIDQWTKYGIEPWLDSDDGDTSYIETTGWNYKQKYFEFQDLPAALTEDKVTLKVKLRDPDGMVTGERLQSYIWDGSQWVLGAYWVYNTPVDRSWIVLSEDITSILNTKSKIDSARVYFQKGTAGDHNIRITFCWLVVGDILTEAPPYGDKWTLTSGNGIASAYITSGEMYVWTLPRF